MRDGIPFGLKPEYLGPARESRWKREFRRHAEMRRERGTRICAGIIRLDRLLRRYGPGADAVRFALRRYAMMKLDDLFPQGAGKKPNVDNPATIKMLEHVQDMILTLRPGDDRRRWLKGEALHLAAEVSETRWLLVQQNANFIPRPVLTLIVFWLTILFASFGLFAPKNLTAT